MSSIRTSNDLSKLRGPAIGCLNIQSMTRKFDDIKLLLARSELNCLGLIETWLNNSDMTVTKVVGNMEAVVWSFMLIENINFNLFWSGISVTRILKLGG